MKKILLEVVTPTRPEISREVDYVVAPTPTGLIGVLPGHAPLLTLLSVGVLRFAVDGNVTRLAIGDGFMRVMPGKAVIMAEAAEMPEEIDVGRALAAKQRAEERLCAVLRDRVDDIRARSSLQRAVNRLNVVKSGSADYDTRGLRDDRE